ncbi:MAG: RIP metalloprotease RseP [Defluviitaleaceae bacterium]|nr:RIP metalloprotease RseP [Defluviitaleaceae bacterium]
MGIMTILSGLLIFTIIVVVHELGHYWTARAAGIHVEEFSIGMGPRLLHFTKNGTTWSIKLFPLGGSCRMMGEDEGIVDPRSFNSKSVWWRILVIAGGAIMNFVLALLLAIALSMFTSSLDATIMGFRGFSPLAQAGAESGDRIVRIGDEYVDMIFGPNLVLTREDTTDVDIVLERNGERLNITATPYFTGERYALCFIVDSPAADAGLQIGDRIVRINDRNVNIYGDFILEMHRADGSPIHLEVERDGNIFSTTVTPIYFEEENRYLVGFTPGRIVGPFFAQTQIDENGETVYIDELNWVQRQTFFGSIADGFHNLTFSVRFTLFAVSSLFSDGLGGLMGPLGIVTTVGDQVEQSLEIGGGMAAFWSLVNFTFMLSVNLGILNLLPLPALDGGRLIFLFLEAIRGKPINPDREGLVHFVGFVLLMALAAVVFYNDIVRMLGA